MTNWLTSYDSEIEQVTRTCFWFDLKNTKTLFRLPLFENIRLLFGFGYTYG